MLGKEQDKEGQEAGVKKWHEETFGSDRYGQYLDYGDCFTGVYICLTYQNVHFKCVLYYISFIPQ